MVPGRDAALQAGWEVPRPVGRQTKSAANGVLTCLCLPAVIGVALVQTRSVLIV